VSRPARLVARHQVTEPQRRLSTWYEHALLTLVFMRSYEIAEMLIELSNSYHLRRQLLLLATLVVQVEQSVACVYVCVDDNF